MPAFEAIPPSAAHGRRKSYAITIASASGSRSIQFRIARWLALCVACAFALLVVLGIVGAVAFGHLVREAGAVRDLKADNLNLRRQMARLGEIERRLAAVDSTRRAVLRVVGVEDPGDRSLGDPIADPPGEVPSGRYTAVTPGANPMLEDLEDIRATLTSNPLSGPRTRGYGPVTGGGIFHTGFDVAAQTGAPVLAAGNGIAAFVGSDDVFGNVLVVAHGPRLSTMYGHASRILVRPGDYVAAGEVIASVGNTGRSSAPHLHFEIQWDGAAIDPAAVFPEPAAGMDRSAEAAR